MRTDGPAGPVDAAPIVRVIDRFGDGVGAGFLLAPDIVATCAHVVATALNVDPEGEHPGGGLSVEFPLHEGVGGPASRSAHVVRWIPIRSNGTGDVALLRLTKPAPAGVRMPPLRRVDRLWDRPFRVLGYPEDMPDGVWVTGRFRAVQGTGWVQLQTDPGHHRVAEGFSGAPVWDVDGGAVVGMTVAVDRNPDTTTAYLIPIEQVLGLDPELLPCPYRGLEPFHEEHAAYFFGRDDDVDRIVATLDRQPVVLVAGRSGAGKSSAVRAGVVPRLRAGGSTIVEFRPTAEPDMAYALAAALRAGVPDEPVLHGDNCGWDVLLVVDQFEELVDDDPARAADLLTLIVELTRPAAVAGGRYRAVLTVRRASLDDVLTPELVALVDAGTVSIPPMNRARLRDVVVGPAEYAPGLAFDDGLVELILDETGVEPGRLPLLESLLTQLWKRRDGGRLTMAGYHAAGGVAGAVRQQAENAVAAMDVAEMATTRALLTRLTGTDRDGAVVRRRRRRDDIPPGTAEVTTRLAAARLVVVGHDPDGTETVELAHQALIDHWPRLRSWLDEDRDFLVWRDDLTDRSQAWEAAGRDPGALLRGAGLAAAMGWLRERATEVGETSRDYIRRSHARQRREVRRWRVVAATLLVLLAVSGVLSAVSLERGDRLERQLATVNAEVLAREAGLRSADDPVTATQLAMAAWRADPQNPQARDALATAYLTTDPSAPAIPAPGAISSFGMSGDGEVMVAVVADAIVVVSGLGAPQPETWTVPEAQATGQAFSISKDGRGLAAVDVGGTVLTWDLALRTGPRVLRGGAAPEFPHSNSVKFSPDSRRLVSLTPAPGGLEITAYDAVSGRTLGGPVKVVDESVRDVWLTNDEELVVLRIADATGVERVETRRIRDGRVMHSFPASAQVVLDGAAVATCFSEESSGVDIVVSDTATGKQTVRVPAARPGFCTSVADYEISADGRHAVEASASDFDGTAFRTVSVTDLLDGSRFDVRTAAVARTEDGDVDRTLAAQLGVLGPDGPQPQAIAVRGNHIIRSTGHVVHQLPRGLPPGGSTLTPDGNYLVSARFPSGVVVTERSTGAERGWLPADAVESADETGGRSASVVSSYTVFAGRDGQWAINTYSLPELRHVSRISVPADLSEDGKLRDLAAFSTDGVALITLIGDSLGFWDIPAGAPTAPSLAVSDPDSALRWKQQVPILSDRPGHPDQVAVVNPDRGTEIWDVTTRQRLRTIPTDVRREGGDILIDPSGDRLAAIGADDAVRLWDVDTGQPVGEPIRLQPTDDLVSFTADGHLLTLGTFDNILRFWRLTDGAPSGTITLGSARWERVETDNGELLLTGAGPTLQVLPTTAARWFDHLCRVAGRGFTPAELAILPSGVEQAPPCS